MEKRFKKLVTYIEDGKKKTKTVRYGQAGKAADGGDRIRPGTKKADAYCARSNAQMKMCPESAKDKNSPLRLSRKKWRCKGSKSE